MLFKLPYLNSNLALTLGYLNPALNNSAFVWSDFALRVKFHTVPIAFTSGIGNAEMSTVST